MAGTLKTMPMVRWRLRQTILAVAASALAATAAHGQVTGRATPLGADTLRISGQVFQLAGIDAVEFHQSCFVDGRPWTCGVSAVRAFQTLVDPVVVTCTPAGRGESDLALAVCTSDEGDLAEIMVRQGWARAFGVGAENYAEAEQQARADATGIWQGHFVDPWDFREDIASIERAYALRAAADLAREAEQLLVIGGDDPIMFDGFATRRADGANDIPVAEIIIGELPAGAIRNTVGPEDIFQWATAAGALRAWREELFNVMAQAAPAAFWTELNGRPGPTVEATDATAFYQAMSEWAESLIGNGRQPVLLISSTQSPEWIRDWLSGSPPEGAIVSRKEDAAASYRGTIDGVDVHTGPAPLNTALIFPADTIVGVTYGEVIAGSFVTIDIDPGNADQLVLRYSRAIEWSADLVLRVTFPAVVEEDPFYEVESP
jgi:endonuclease YncB( thermonuclease family)